MKRRIRVVFIGGPHDGLIDPAMEFDTIPCSIWLYHPRAQIGADVHAGLPPEVERILRQPLISKIAAALEGEEIAPSVRDPSLSRPLEYQVICRDNAEQPDENGVMTTVWVRYKP